MGYIIVAEKYSVANAISKALSSINVRDARVTWVNGHVFNIDLPLEFKHWRLDNLEDILKVRDFRYIVVDRKSYSRLKGYFNSNNTLVIATDNDHEGELIGYEILNIYRGIKGKDAPYLRMRFNSTALKELIDAWGRLESTLNWRWVYKAIFRQRFDLLTGAAYTRLLTLANRRGLSLYAKGNGYGKAYKVLSWGSCQTPTLYFTVQREREIESFKSKDYWYVRAELEHNGIRFTVTSKAVYSIEEAEHMRDAVKDASYAIVKDYKEHKKGVERPLPIRTDDALKDLTRIAGVNAYRILQVMEELYSSGYISYPRTDTNRYASNFDFTTAMRAASNGLGIEVRGRPMPRNGRSDDNAHPPIYPTGAYKGSGMARSVWEYIARRFLANAYYSDALMLIQDAKLMLNGIELYTHGSSILEEGFLSIYHYFKPKNEPIPRMSIGDKVRVIDAKVVKDKTKPPSRLSEPELLELMERNGIGTDATRAEFPMLIQRRGYAVKVKGRFKPTSIGARLIDTLEGIDARLVKPDTRAMVESTMSMIEKGEVKYDDALEKSIRIYSTLLSLCKSRINLIGKIVVGDEANKGI